MKNKLLLSLFLLISSTMTFAQRTMDKLNRGLVAMKTTNGIYCSWRIYGEEYYDVTYNIYRDGTKINETPLSVSNFTDVSGSLSNKYSVEPVVRGVAQTKSAAVTPWANNYLDIKLGKVYSRRGTDITASYEPNDVSVADLDGDGEMELLLKRKSLLDADGLFAIDNDSTYDMLEAYKLDGTRLWYIDVGPNMVSGSSVEINIVAYDWDGDGKAEVLLRGADNMIIHMADGSTQVVGNANVNTRNTVSHSANMTYTNTGAEYLIYLNGETAKPYQIIDYPLERGNANDWGDGYGHRSSKYFFGAPFLDGRKPSIFLARGIYTRHKMIALDVDPATHNLVKRWYWECLDSSSPWFGNGFHNYGIADVDWDGRDEIVYGSMVIDDNGFGLSTTGLGHGDAQHCSDFDPYTHGSEIFTCNETAPNNCYRDATTAKIYYRSVSGNDDGRAMMANVTDLYPGCLGTSAHDGNVISSVTHEGVAPSGGIDQNFAIYWDGDLLRETFNYSGFVTNNGYYETGNPRIWKYGKGQIATFPDSKTCNGTKGTPSFQGDIMGDWREELVLRTDDNNLRLFVSPVPTEYRNYTLWHDIQYRQAMVWEMCGYNQPPHPSYFIGKLEGITIAPPPLTMTGKSEVANNGTISASLNEKSIITCETNDMNINVADGVSPYIYTDNAPTWVQGHTDNNNITTTTYTHTLTGGAFSGNMRLVKQGDGVLVLPKVTETYSGNTDVWNGTLSFDGTMQNSRVWLNRHTSLISDGGKFAKGIQADYNATIIPGGEDKKGTIEVDSLILNFGSVVSVDVFGEDNTADVIKAKVLKIEKKVWDNGPQYSSPIFRFNSHFASGKNMLTEGAYLIGEVEKVDGDIENIVVEGLNGQKAVISYSDGKLYLTITNYVSDDVTWMGNEDGKWNLDETSNFISNTTNEVVNFVPMDNVVFDDKATNTDVTVVGHVAPSNITFNNVTKSYTLNGDSIVGEAPLTKNGTGSLTINNVNRIGNTIINGGRVTVGLLANKIGTDYGALGDINKTITINNNAVLGVNQSITAVQPIIIGEGGGTIDITSGKTLTMNSGVQAKDASTAVLYKQGGGTLTLGANNKISKLTIAAGSVNATESASITQLPDFVELRGGVLYDTNSEGSYSTNKANFIVPVNATGTFYADPRCNYTGSLTGSGTFNVYAAGIRNYFGGDWSEFEGTIVPGLSKRGTYDPSFDFTSNKGIPKATLKMNEGVTFNNDGHNVEVGKVTGTAGTLAGSGTYILGCDNSNFSFGVNSTSKIIKRGTGYMTLSIGKVAASLTVEEGLLKFNSTSTTDMVIGSNTMYVKGTAGIEGRGYLQSLIMSDNSYLTPKSTYGTTPGTIKLNTMLSSTGNSVINFLISSSSNSKLEVGNGLSLSRISVTLVSGFTPKKGDEFTLWTCTTLQSAPSEISLPSLPEGLYWDASGLTATTGVLKVTDNPTLGIDSNLDNVASVYDVYTTAGVKLGEVKAVESELKKSVRALGAESGTYILRRKDAKKTGVLKLIIK